MLGADPFYRRPPEHSVPAFQSAWTHEDGAFPWERGLAVRPGLPAAAGHLAGLSHGPL